MLEKIKENLFSNVFTAIGSILFTCVVFYIYSQPSSSEEIKSELFSITEKYIEENYSGSFKDLELNKYLSQEIDLSSNKVVFFFGTMTDDKDNLFRWISVYERKDANLIDELLGKDGFFEIKSLAMFEVPYPDVMVFDNVELIDIDKDGQKEIHIRFKSVWADSRGIAPLILRKNNQGAWIYIGLPSVNLAIEMNPERDLSPIARPFTHFGARNSDEEVIEKSVDELTVMGTSGHDWVLEFPDRKQIFSSLRNGGGYFFNNHPIKGYFQILWVSFIKDGRATLDSHYAVVRVFKYGSDQLVVDELWNWGKPVFSGVPLDPIDLSVNSLYWSGVMSHVGGDKGELYFGFTEFEKVGIPDGFGQLNGTALNKLK
ncbi:hypothetical protein [Vibrio parahaemolyticus]|uniref:hypothetical protein n=1 Tax=Vibrio parahaemolyticus TaxID=670 RepID=UPI000C86B9C0|nr:hypothetical protein [Vibrio parahaemolyticus]MCR9833368.1 hypothetical protein [Vibrio parahaemolyticus]PMT59775.1 hypothetical protein C1S87_19185 [Vibrio parahaemolyticus]PMT84457.1 hypothetical protein C1S83_22400 [Vibrio parahaemolyticus]PMT86980.1 hypothetical protein C1T03_21915 [Vibrio parahaemolyticus]